MTTTTAAPQAGAGDGLVAEAGRDRAALVPAGFVLEEHYGGDARCRPWAGEEELVGPAWAKSRYQSLIARECARRALVQLGRQPAAIPRLPAGGPAWPDGVVGSLTHCDGYRAAIVGPASAGRSAGVDAEPHRPLPRGVLKLIASDAEQQLIGRLSAANPGIRWDTLLFCAKEAAYKARFPLAGNWLAMTQATAWLDAKGSFRVTIRLRENQHGDLGLLSWKGQWSIRAGIMLAVTVGEPLA